MVDNLHRYGVITSRKVAEVMETIDRALFVPSGGGLQPYVDSPMPIGYNATISAPHMHATCLQLLEKNLQPGMRVLDVGSGIVHELFSIIIARANELSIITFSFLIYSNVLKRNPKSLLIRNEFHSTTIVFVYFVIYES